MERLEERINYCFKNKKLLENALTHSSYAKEHSLPYRDNNERLEFIGDAYLDAVIGQTLFDTMKSAEEGKLSKRRAAVVCEESLADIARRIKLGEHIRLGKGEAGCNGADKDSILSDALEAVFGAIIMDGGFEAGRKVIMTLLAEKLDLAVSGKLYVDHKSDLQELIQARYKNAVKLSYEVIADEGPAHDKTFTVAVKAGDKLLGTGSGKSKLKAEQAAASDAIMKGDISVL